MKIKIKRIKIKLILNFYHLVNQSKKNPFKKYKERNKIRKKKIIKINKINKRLKLLKCKFLKIPYQT